MIEKFVRWMIKKWLPGYCLSRIGSRKRKEKVMGANNGEVGNE